MIAGNTAPATRTRTLELGTASGQEQVGGEGLALAEGDLEVAMLHGLTRVRDTKRVYGVDGGRICKSPGSSSRTASTNTRNFAAGVPVR